MPPTSSNTMPLDCLGSGRGYPIELSDADYFAQLSVSVALITNGLPCSLQLYAGPHCEGPVFVEHENGGSETFCTDFSGAEGGSLFVQCDAGGHSRTI